MIVDIWKGLDDINLVFDLKKILVFEMLYIIVYWRFDFELYKVLLFM